MLEIVEKQLRILGDKIPDRLAEDCHLVDDLGLDSLDRLEFIANVEYVLGVEFPAEALPGLTSLAAVTDYAIECLSG